MNTPTLNAAEKSGIRESLVSWLDEHPTGAAIIAGIGGVAATLLSMKGIETFANIGIPASQEVVYTFDGAGAGSLAGALVLNHVLG
ncbi:MAG: hypothetical protein WDN66_02590 [Candidatus Saccharibacteria bacterium]